MVVSTQLFYTNHKTRMEDNWELSLFHFLGMGVGLFLEGASDGHAKIAHLPVQREAGCLNAHRGTGADSCDCKHHNVTDGPALVSPASLILSLSRRMCRYCGLLSWLVKGDPWMTLHGKRMRYQGGYPSI